LNVTLACLTLRGIISRRLTPARSRVQSRPRRATTCPTTSATTTRVWTSPRATMRLSSNCTTMVTDCRKASGQRRSPARILAGR